MNYRSILASALAIALLGGASTAAWAYPGQSLAAHARIQVAEARDIALHARPGVVTAEELERERGGSGLRYSFDIRTDSGVYEVGVDAQTGAVLENAREGAHAD